MSVIAAYAMLTGIASARQTTLASVSVVPVIHSYRSVMNGMLMRAFRSSMTHFTGSAKPFTTAAIV
jgi:hypothetical protein